MSDSMTGGGMEMSESWAMDRAGEVSARVCGPCSARSVRRAVLRLVGMLCVGMVAGACDGRTQPAAVQGEQQPTPKGVQEKPGSEAGLGAGAGRAGQAGSRMDEKKARVELLAERARVRDGEDVVVALHFTIAKEWHIYSNLLCDTGMTPSWKFTLPEGWSEGAVQWPAPERHVSPGDLLDHIYEHDATVLVTLHQAKVGGQGDREVRVGVDASWLVCSNVCLAEEGHAELAITIAPATKAEVGAADARVAAARAKMPAPAADAARDGVVMHASGDRAEFFAVGAEAMTFMPAETGLQYVDLLHDASVEGTVAVRQVLSGAALAPWQTGDGKQADPKGTGLRVRFRAENSVGGTVGGVLVVRSAGTSRAYNVHVAVEQAGGGTTTPASTPANPR